MLAVLFPNNHVLKQSLASLDPLIGTSLDFGIVASFLNIFTVRSLKSLCLIVTKPPICNSYYDVYKIYFHMDTLLVILRFSTHILN